MHLVKIMLVIIFSKIGVILTTECVEIRPPKIRKFPSLTLYQSNKIPFDPRNSTMGNYVSFDLKKLDNIPRNAFVTFDSEHIIKIDLNGKWIRKISDGAFLSLTCLNFLTIASNNVSELTWQTFEGLGNLRELDISDNKLKNIPDMAFTKLAGLTKLDLSANLLRALSSFSFSNMTKLRYLNLAKNNLMYIKPEVFQPLMGLLSLDLSFNKLSDLELDLWDLPNLEVFNLAGNYLKSFDTSLNYSFTNLQKLNLSMNYLTEFNIHALNKNFQKLTVIDLNRNYWRCDYLARMLHFLADSKVRFPARNTSEVNELGIDCDNNTQITHIFSETFTTTTIITPTKNVITNSNNNSKLENQIHVVAINNDKILLEISGIRKLLIFCLFFFVVFVIIYASVQVGLCDGLRKKFCRRQGYIDTSIQDNYSMLRS